MRATAQNPGCEPCAEPALSYRFIKRVRRNLDGVLNTIRVAVRHRALAKVHPLLSSTVRCLFANRVVPVGVHFPALAKLGRPLLFFLFFF
jgi:hypothetical protein